jgi:hypothetical protein
MLKLLLIIPILGCLPLIMIRGAADADKASIQKTNSLLKSIALSTSLLTLFISIVI